MEKVVVVCVTCLLSYILLIAVFECTYILYKDYSQDCGTEQHQLGKTNISEFMNNSYSAGKHQKNHTRSENGIFYN